MRPVDKPPGNSIGVSTRYTPVTNFTFIKGKAKTIAKANWGTNNPTAVQAVVELQRINRKDKSTRSKDEKTIKKAISGKVAAEYKKAASVLMLFLGAYCSYCETIIAQLAEVEHVMPKSIMSTRALAWDNFLLSCGPCNNAKSNNPSLGKMKTLLNIATIPTDTQYQQGLTNFYVWPDQDPKSYKWMTYALARVAGGGVTALSGGEQESIRHQNVVYDPFARTVRADIYDPATPGYNTYTVRVTVTGTGGTGTNKPNNAAAAKRTIDLTQINEQRGDQDQYDSRVNRRTQVWFGAVNAITRIRQHNAANSNQQFYDDLWNQVMDTARASGFFSTWLTVFNKYPHYTNFNNEEYNSKFLALTNMNNFKNTLKTNLPT